MTTSFYPFLIPAVLIEMLCMILLPCVSLTSFLFGDSLIDVGNNDYLFTLSKADSPPYGIDFSPSGGQPTGRFTNGRTVSDIIGFVNAKDPCCGGYFPPFVCFQTKDNNSSSILCEDRSKYVFWDAYHPTEAANLIMAKKLLDGDQTISSPISVRQLYQNFSRAT